MDAGGSAPLIGFKRHLRVDVAGAAAYLASESGVTVLEGADIAAVAPLLDGTRSLPALLEDAPADVSPEQVGRLLLRLAEAELLALRSPVTDASTDDRTTAFWEAGGLDATTAVRNTATTRVRLICAADCDASPARSALRAAGLIVLPDPPAESPTEADLAGVDLSVVLCDDYLDPCLAGIDAAHRAAGVPWLLAKPMGTRVWIGPIFQPGDRGCWHCLTARLALHRRAEICLRHALSRPEPLRRPAGTLPPLRSAALHLITLAATKWLAGQRHPSQRGVWTFDSVDFTSRTHELRARPQCPGCGDPGLMREQARRPVPLNAGRTATRGGHRTWRPEEVLDRCRHLISPITGVVKQIRRRGPAFFNSYRSGPNLALGIRGFDTLRAALRIENGGKGVTPAQAEASALGEALERHSGTFQGDEERVRGSLRALGGRALDPRTCQLFDEQQYAGRADWNAAHGPFQYVCEPFDDRAELDWSPVWSVDRREHLLLPTGLLYFGAPGEPGWSPVRADSNGNAAGASLEDAALQGLLELVERDAVALWWYNRTRAPAVDLDAFGDPWIHRLREVYAELRREVWVLDLTSDVEIPVLAAVSRRTDSPREEIMLGFGADLDPAVALRRALTELNQLMPMVVEGDAEGEYGCDDPDAVWWWRNATVVNQPYLVADPAVTPRGPARNGRGPGRDLGADIEGIRARLTEQGMEMLVLDQTRPDIALPTVKVIVPGMRHFWARFAPGRLYDVPVRLGRLAEPTPYDDLNPVPLFL